jgi:AcrR family transcriptional regulator
MVKGAPRRGRPRDPGVDEAVLAAAVELLADAGFARLTMEQVATRAGVGKASVYLRWPNKVALVAEAIQHRAGVVPDVPDTGTLPGDMRRFLRALLRTFGAASRAMAAVTGEVDRHPELRAAWRRSLTAALTDCVREIVDRAVEREELPAASDVELLSMLPVTLLQNWRLEHGQSPDDAAVDRIVNQFYTPS